MGQVKPIWEWTGWVQGRRSGVDVAKTKMTVSLAESEAIGHDVCVVVHEGGCPCTGWCQCGRGYRQARAAETELALEAALNVAARRIVALETEARQR